METCDTRLTERFKASFDEINQNNDKIIVEEANFRDSSIDIEKVIIHQGLNDNANLFSNNSYREFMSNRYYMNGNMFDPMIIQVNAVIHSNIRLRFLK